MTKNTISKYKVTFLPEDIEISISEGTTVLQAAAEAGIQLEGPCAGKGTCGKCWVHLVEEGAERRVLACKTPVKENITVSIARNEVSLYRKGEDDTSDPKMTVDLGIWKRAVSVAKPELTHQYSDLTRLYKALGQELPLSLTALKTLPAMLRAENHQITVAYTKDQILSVEPGNTERELYGLAVDIGTTTLVAALMDLQTGHVSGIASTTNPQNIFGADVISRIEHTINYPHGLEQLQGRVVQAINHLLDKLCNKTGIVPKNIYRVIIAGNTAMEHLFLGIDPRHLAPAPFIPVITHPISLEARDIGLNVYPHGSIHLVPNIAGYVGGDITSVIIATDIYKKPGRHLAVDIGTNGEMVLSVDGNMLTCSTAAGPAFEGAHIRFGMRAAPGSIEGVEYNGDISLKVIGDALPTGICGSGLLQAVQVLVAIGAVNPSGKLLSRGEGEKNGLARPILNRLGSDEQGNFFLLSDPGDEGRIVITQNDIREIQLAKGAIRTGIEILLLEAGITAEDIDEVLLAGAFGNYLNVESALALGLLPEACNGRIRQVGNAAGTGARMVLVSDTLLKKAYNISQNIKHIELSGRRDFHEMFIDYMGFE